MILFSKAFIILCFAAFVLYWIWSARSAKPTMERRGYRWGLITIIGIIVVVRLLVGRRFPMPNLWPRTDADMFVADILTFVGLVITIWSRIILGGNWSRGVEFKQGHELIERGPYAKIRHPIYTGILLLFAGVVIYHASLASIALFVFIFIRFWLKANSEEKLMTEHFPEYPAYKAHTWRLVPYLI